MLIGWKTLIFSAAVALVGTAQTFNWASVLNEKNAGIAMLVIGAVSAVLRFFTSTPAMSSEPN